jgi:hypothetical protein
VQKDDPKMPARGLSLLLMVVGAILVFAVHVSVFGVSLYAVGSILMLVGAADALLSSMLWTSFAPFAPRETVIRRTPTTRW